MAMPKLELEAGCPSRNGDLCGRRDDFGRTASLTHHPVLRHGPVHPAPPATLAASCSVKVLYPLPRGRDMLYRICAPNNFCASSLEELLNLIQKLVWSKLKTNATIEVYLFLAKTFSE